MIALRPKRKKQLVNNANPLRVDPTRTLSIRQAFIRELKRRFRRLRLSVKEFVDTLDALGLKDRRPGLALLVSPREFQFLTDEAKLKAFNEWFRQQVEKEIFSVTRGTAFDEPWTTEYVSSAYKRGLINAYIAAKRADFEITEDQARFLRGSFNKPEAMSKVRLLATRTLEDLRGISATMGSQLNTILAQSMIDGTGAIEIARQMSNRIDSLTFSRALTIARTEIINAHSEGQLDAYEKLGVEELGLMVEWSTAGDDRVCSICSAREGQILSVDEARGIIPIHPNCRCAWLPAVNLPKSKK